jgi:hypothetical protein
LAARLANPANMTREKNWRRRLRTGALVVFSLLLTGVDIHFIGVRVPGYWASAEAAESVVKGLPHWRIFQSRVLGPYSIHFIAKWLSVSPASAYLIFGAFCLALAKLIVVWHRQKDESAAPTLLMLAGLTTLFALMLNDEWLYPWDLAGLALFTGFVVMVTRDVAWPWFVPLILLAFLNRESAIFICVWLALQGMLGKGQGLDRRRPNLRMVATAIVLVVLGLWLTDRLRDVLLVRETGPAIWHYEPPRTKWFVWTAGTNLESFSSTLAAEDLALPSLCFAVPLLGMAAALLVGFRSFPRHAALCAAVGLNILSVLLFGVVTETRVMIELIPFFAVFLPSLAFGQSPAR